MSLPYSEGFMMVISEPQGSSLDMGRCSTVGCWQPLCISLRVSWFLLSNCRIKNIAEHLDAFLFCGCCLAFLC